MRKILIWILPLFALAGCVKEEPETAEGTKARLTLNIYEEGLRLAARAADEKAVQDVNVFLYDVRRIARPQHFYVRGDVLECSVPVGEYEVYAVANLHEDMGAMDREELLAYEFRVPRSYASLPMSGQAVCTVGPKTQSVTVSVRRNVAKIVCNISLDGTFYDLKLQSVQMMDMAGSTMLFSENQQARELCSSELSTMASYEVRKASRTYYLAENCRGEVPGIVNQQQKCADNAPEGATFLRIKAQRGSRQVIYDVYLGENNTTNFDVRRNTVYTLKIVIRGEKETDTRVDAFEVGITDNFPYEGYLFEGYCLYEPGKRLNLTVENPQAAGDLSATVRLLQGQHGAFLFNGQPLTSSVTLPLNDPSGVYSFPVDYIPGGVFTADNYRLVYEVEVSNTGGYRYTKTFTHDFYNLLTIYTSWKRSTTHRGRGGVDYDNMSVVKWSASYSNESSRTMILSLDDGPLVPLKPVDGSRFDAWYADSDLTHPVAAENPYRHPMKSFRDTLYVNFEQEAVYIYTQVDLVEMSCDSDFRTDYEKQAFVVPIGSRCTFRGTAGKTVAVWWSNFENHYPRKELSREPEYSFTAWDNCNVVPEYPAD
ncbi:hypothetical protein [Alistipes communis]|jgi:hypothetical protein|uniref:DUF4906 domain-containing protein n=1 Tax=Alistipes communis TaxID=2585118 RepID=UPI003AB2537E